MKRFWQWSLVGFSLSLAWAGVESLPGMARPAPPSMVAQAGEGTEVDRLYEKIAELYGQGKYAEAIPLAERWVAIARGTLSPKDPKLANSLGWLAELYRAQGQYTQAEPLYLEALKIVRQALGDSHPHVATTLNNLAELYRAQGQYTQAEPLYLEALKIVRQALGNTHPHIASTLNNLGLLYKSQGQYAQAESLYLEAEKIFHQALGDTHPLVATTLSNVSILHWAKNDIPTALQYLQNGLDSGLADRGVRLELRPIPPSSLCQGSCLAGRVSLGIYLGNSVLSRSFEAEGAGLGWSGLARGMGLGLRVVNWGVMEKPLTHC